ncbi:hypothetical protein [uncultured Tateyamaria sp.]|uniref:hypothetical protein n=1 Tax=uncultured Tateyamaria sp. TaxID=455651 RepID=UPI002631CE6D|nr:hypothetical protein [uncultured Tateyamaria sp.]
MNIFLLSALPIAAGVLVVLANLPALIKLRQMIRDGEADNQSLYRNYLLLAGNGLLFIYTATIGDLFLAIASAINTTLLLIIIGLIFISRRT